LIKELGVAEVVFAYSDVSYDTISELERQVQNAGAILRMADVERMMIPSLKHLVSVTAVRTGCGKSAVTRRVVEIFAQKGRRVAVIRHPMPYGDLAAQELQVFRTMDDLDRHGCTIEDRCIVGMGSVVLDRAHIGARCIVGAGPVVTPGTVVPQGQLVLGAPARARRSLTEAELAWIESSADHYVELAETYLAG
jgi:hypothetical protein